MTEDFKNLLPILEEYAAEFERIYKEKLQADNRQATGKLINSIKTKVRQGKDYFSVVFNAAEYWKYVEEGRKSGKYPPREAILNWIRAKKILPRPDANGKLPTEEQLSYLIQRAIGRYGTIKDKNYDGGHYVATTVEELNAIYLPRMEAALQIDMEDVTIEMFEGAFTKLRKLI